MVTMEELYRDALMVGLNRLKRTVDCDKLEKNENLIFQ